MSETRTIEVGYLARVEGEGSLKAEVIDDFDEALEHHEDSPVG